MVIWLDVIVLKVQHVDMQKELAAAGGLDKLFPTDTWPQVGGAHVRVVCRVLGVASACFRPTQFGRLLRR